MRFEFKNIFIISPEPWGLNFISKHHYAIKLAERENNVFFFNPPGNEFKKTVISKMLTVIDYKPIMRGINKLPGMIRDRLAANDIKRIKNKLHIPSPDIIWSFDAFRFSNLNIFGRGALKIYYAADLRNTPLEQLLLDTADLVLAPSNQILRHFQTSTPKFFVNHGLSDHFLIEYNYKLSNKGQKLKAGYVGNIVSRFIDYELMLKTIINNPSVDFYFIGPYDISNLTIKVDDDIKAAISKLKQQQNVILLGSKPFKELILHYEYLDFFWLCYDTVKYYDEASNSHKIIEYLSTGKPIVSTVIDTYKSSNLLIFPDEKNSFDEVFKNAINHYQELMTPAKVENRLNFARENTYAKHIARIEKLILDHIN